jgi:hypothetical protein
MGANMRFLLVYRLLTSLPPVTLHSVPPTHKEAFKFSHSTQLTISAALFVCLFVCLFVYSPLLPDLKNDALLKWLTLKDQAEIPISAENLT